MARRPTEDDLAFLTRRDKIRVAMLLVVIAVAVLWASVFFLKPAPPRHIVFASGPDFGLYHTYARRYIESLARDGVTVEERATNGAAENLRLLLDPDSGVDVAFMQGGVATFPEADGIVMLASLYYEPLWIFYRDKATLTQISELHGRRIAVGTVGSGTLAIAKRLIEINALTPRDTEIVTIGGTTALDALKAGEVDAALFVGGALTPAILSALLDPDIKLMSLANADAYPRRFPFVTKLTLPAGTVDLGRHIPKLDVAMIGTEAMLAARRDLHPALINLFLDAARELHGRQGYFEAAGEFPNTTHVDLPVSTIADQHTHFGPSFLHRFLPFWLATLVERTIIVVIPLLVIVVPLVRYVPDYLRFRVRSRIYRWYGELALLERDVATRKGTLPVEKWLQDLNRIAMAVEGIKTPASFASEAYTLREHVGLVRSAVLAKVGGHEATASHSTGT
jgi:TRAP transporter TAXI family solute receptor